MAPRGRPLTCSADRRADEISPTLRGSPSKMGAGSLLPPPSLLLLALWSLVVNPVLAETDSTDVSALNVMYSSLNSASQLTGWSSKGGDPCGDGWKGITCSGSSITEISLPDLGLSGTMGYQLSGLTSVTYFDMSKNNLGGNIPYQLPPNVVHLDLAGNAFHGGIPFSISQMNDLKYLNLANNQLNGQLPEMFGKLSSLSALDLSFNHFSGNLPKSFGSLSSIKTLYLQNNQFHGPIDILGSLLLKDLNVENNQFIGWIPKKLQTIDNLKVDGNNWSSGPAPPGLAKAQSNNGGKKSSHSGVIAITIGGVIIGLLVAIIFFLKLVKKRSSASSPYIDGRHHYSEEQLSQKTSSAPLVYDELRGLKDSSSSIDIKSLESSPSVELKPPPPDLQKSVNDDEFENKLYPTSSTKSLVLTAYSLIDLQAATLSFSSNRLVGQGTIGRVYKAKFTDGKVLALKKIDMVNLSGGTSYNFMDAVSRISKLHHPNIAELLGYCSEPGYSLLVYEYQRNGSLHRFLHLSDDYSNPLTWDTRVRIALGTARALEYLHEVCSPSVIHKSIKSANILLDAELNPHLCDSGLADFYEDTIENLGPGYSAPECSQSSSYTMKSDVYSFGVVMLELLTGRKPYDSSKPSMEQYLVRWVIPQLHDIDALSQMVDPALRGLYPPKSLSRFADAIALCVQLEPDFRPSMSEVVQMLVHLCSMREY